MHTNMHATATIPLSVRLYFSQKCCELFAFYSAPIRRVLQFAPSVVVKWMVLERITQHLPAGSLYNLLVRQSYTVQNCCVLDSGIAPTYCAVVAMV